MMGNRQPSGLMVLMKSSGTILCKEDTGWCLILTTSLNLIWKQNPMVWNWQPICLVGNSGLTTSDSRTSPHKILKSSTYLGTACPPGDQTSFALSPLCFSKQLISCSTASANFSVPAASEAATSNWEALSHGSSRAALNKTPSGLDKQIGEGTNGRSEELISLDDFRL